MREKNNNQILFLTRAAVIAAAYVALTLLFAPISFDAIQVRISEALTILPFFLPEAVPGLFVGCILGNLIGGAIVPDIIFGSIATLLGAVGTYMLGRHRSPVWVATIPPIAANTMIIPFVLYFGYGLKGSTPAVILYYALTIFIGEVIACGVGGTLLALFLRKVPSIWGPRS